jgi:long-chain fatty acid transport protein
MNKTLLRILFLWGIISVFPTATARAGGLYLNEFATPSMGTAGAGAQAWADNASTAFFNPAGMTQLDGN